MPKKVTIVESSLLKAHERTRKVRSDELEQEIKHDGFISTPVLVDQNTMIILDGHHRVDVLRRLGLTKVPVFFVDYMNDAIRVTSWRKGERVTKKKVIEAGLSGKLMRIKTSRHLYSRRAIATKVPLKDLK